MRLLFFGYTKFSDRPGYIPFYHHYSPTICHDIPLYSLYMQLFFLEIAINSHNFAG